MLSVTVAQCAAVITLAAASSYLVLHPEILWVLPSISPGLSIAAQLLCGSHLLGGEVPELPSIWAWVGCEAFVFIGSVALFAFGFTQKWESTQMCFGQQIFAVLTHFIPVVRHYGLVPRTPSGMLTTVGLTHLPRRCFVANSRRITTVLRS